MAEKSSTIPRPPVIAIMGHVDHGKSTLLDYIRKTNVVESETGGITQRISAYEVIHKGSDGKEHAITFLDTPGHEAFTSIRARGAHVADIAVLVVSAEDGVKPQTVEAFKIIQKSQTPFIIAINKIDKEGADLDRTKLSLAEHEIYVEGYGGTVPFVPISAKTGQGVSDLLDMLLLQAELEELTGNPNQKAEGVIIEANLDKKKGISATIIVKNGTLHTGEVVIAGAAMSPVRILENFLGKPIKQATFSNPIRLIGWNQVPEVGSMITVFDSKKEAEQFIAETTEKATPVNLRGEDKDDIAIIPILIKASDVGGLDAIEHEVKKIKNERSKVKIISKGVGDISENDVKLASGKEGTIIVGFNVKADATARSHAEKTLVTIQTFDIIYKLSEWLTEAVTNLTPRMKVEEAQGVVKILKVFSKTKDKQVLGGRCERGLITLGAEVKILRRDFEIGRGKIRELQRMKDKVSEVPEGQEFGTLVESKIEIAPGDKLETFVIVEK